MARLGGGPIAMSLVGTLVSVGPAATPNPFLIAGAPRTSATTPSRPERVVAHDNTRAAGRIDGKTVTVRLRAASGQWQPEGPDGPSLTVEAFGEEGEGLTVPAPLIRVTEGASIAVSIRNDLAEPLRVYGLCARDGQACAPVEVAPNSTSNVRFASGRAGTYHYWATTMRAPMPFRELAGALVVDPPGAAVDPDRIFVITEWTSLTTAQLGEILSADEPSEKFLALRPQLTFVMNGLSWPATERLTYRQGEIVRWRVINLSSQPHPMHLHGFYFTVLSTGDGHRDESIAGGEGRRVVTQLLPSGGTVSLRWVPQREGNWLFHCHIMAHVSPDRRLRAAPVPADANALRNAHQHHGQADPSLGMAGMVLGITVLPPEDRPRAAVPAPPARTLKMVIEPQRDAPHEASKIRIAVGDQTALQEDQHVSSSGPPLVLRRGEPVAIRVVNRLTERTSIHWHGLEIDSYYDGVHGWSGIGGRTAPMIEPGASFVVRITPPRAGTFIYHTHLHDYRQLSSGLYGPLIVTEPGEIYDTAVDHVIVLGRRDASEASSILAEVSSVVINGEHAPRWVWRAGERHRIRLINIAPDDIFVVSLVKGDERPHWRPLTKDGAPVPAAERQPGPARVKIAVGETYDFEYEALPGRGGLWLEVRTTSGKWQAQGRVVLK